MSQATPGLCQNTFDPVERVLGLFNALVTVLARPASLEGMLDEALQTAVHWLGALGGAVTVWEPGVWSPAITACSGVLADHCASQWLNGHLNRATAPLDRALLQGLAVEWGEFAAASRGLSLLGATAWLTHRGEYGFGCIVGRLEPVPSRANAGGANWRQDALTAAAGLVGHAMERMRLGAEIEARLAQRDAAWSSLYDLAVRLTRDLDADRLLDAIVMRAIELLHARGGALSLVEEATGDNVVTVAYLAGRPAYEMLGHRTAAGVGLAGRITASGQPALLLDYDFAAEPIAPGRPAARASLVAAPLFVQGRCVGVLGVGEDANVRRFTHDDVQTLVLLAQQAGALLAAARGRAQDEALAIHRERARLARELHDGLAQNLASLFMKAELCHHLAAGANLELAAELDQLAHGLQRAIRETRAAIFSLHDAPGSGQEFPDALRLLADQHREQTGQAVAVTCEGGAYKRLTLAQRTALLGVAQEALANVRKHAQASQVRVDLNTSCPKKAVLSVHDDGCGFDPDQAGGALRGHFGVLGMQTRVQELGGSLLIETGTGCGTTVTATLPLVSGGGGEDAEDQGSHRR